MEALKNAPLGKPTTYLTHYTPELLFPIARAPGRSLIGITQALPFYGFDTWNAYELTWLNPKGKPIVAIAQLDVPCDSPNIVESKSLKLYLNSFSDTRFATPQAVRTTLLQDLSRVCGSPVAVQLNPLSDYCGVSLQRFEGICLDNLDIHVDSCDVTPALLSVTGSDVIEETLFTHLLKSNCPVTGQPDFASVQIQYCGAPISQAGVLQYIISLRNHNEFHEQCVERIFIDMMTHCKPNSLTVHARYTRRGGLDINPIRSTRNIAVATNIRMARQ